MSRDTRQKRAIQEALRAAGRPLSPEEIRDKAASRVPTLGIATVYRNIKQAVEEGWLKSVALPGQNARHFELSELPHHHHFSCRDCGRVFDVPGCPGSMKDLAPRGFTVERHEVVLYGICERCNQRPARARG